MTVNQQGQTVTGSQTSIGGKRPPQTRLERDADAIHAVLLDAIPENSDYAAVLIALNRLSDETVALWAERDPI